MDGVFYKELTIIECSRMQGLNSKQKYFD